MISTGSQSKLTKLCKIGGQVMTMEQFAMLDKEHEVSEDPFWEERKLAVDGRFNRKLADKCHICRKSFEAEHQVLCLPCNPLEHVLHW